MPSHLQIYDERDYKINILSTEHIGGSVVLNQSIESISFLHWNLFGYSSLKVNCINIYTLPRVK